MPPELLMDPARVDLDHVLADQEAIRLLNPQRYEMEQLNGVIQIDKEQNLFVGYKNVRADEFWARGHMPGYPIMPGVLMCEAAAQLCSYFARTVGLLSGDFVGFGGMENVRFRGKVLPGDRLVLVAKLQKTNRHRTLINVQGFVGATMVFHGDIIGMPMSRQGIASEGGEA